MCVCVCVCVCAKSHLEKSCGLIAFKDRDTTMRGVFGFDCVLPAAECWFDGGAEVVQYGR